MVLERSESTSRKDGVILELSSSKRSVGEPLFLDSTFGTGSRESIGSCLRHFEVASLWGMASALCAFGLRGMVSGWWLVVRNVIETILLHILFTAYCLLTTYNIPVY